MLEPVPPPTFPRALALGLAAGALALACNRGGASSSATELAPLPAVVPSATSAATPPPSTPATTPGGCSLGTPFQLRPVRTRLLGAFREPNAQQLLVATVPESAGTDAGFGLAGEVTLSVVSRAGVATRLRSIELPGGSVPERAWRSNVGHIMVAYRRDGVPHLGHAAGATLQEIDLSSLGVTAENAGTIVPRDDPSESRRAGVPLHNTWSYTPSISVCDIDTEGFRPLACGWDVRTPYLNQLLVAPERATIAPSPQGARAWTMLGRSEVFRPSRYWNGSPNGLDLDPAHAGPMSVVSRMGTGELAVWVNRQGVLNLERVATNGALEGAAIPLPFVSPQLDDAAGTQSEVLVTATTRADAQATPPTTTLIRLDPALTSPIPITAPPVRLPLAAAHIVALEGNEALLWSPDTGDAMYLFCGPSP